ncbi:NAD(P)/FAD-dependent oxidoreductase [Candidatus Micrarchaeota archaeon]|nr:NAD(P)/FAD-dependent oxidoreductase [Candidatus Micrarchaeota archaeon]
MLDLIISGAGPAGCLAAKTACEQGASASIFEEHARIGVPTQCSGLVSKTGLDALGIDYSSAVVNELNGANVYCLDNCLHVKAKETKAILLDRKKFDEICAQEAEKAGAKIKLGKRLKKNDLISSARNSTIIGADGAYSSVAGAFNFPKINSWASCFQSFFERAQIEDKKSVSIVFSSELFPGFFGWVIPENEESCRVGFGANPKQNKCDMKTTFRAFLETKRVKEIIPKAKMVSFHGGVIPLETRKQTVKKNVLLAGDAAGQVKATTGGGIFFGCSCAKIAGELAATGKASEYEHAWRKQFEKDLKTHANIRKFLNSSSDNALANYFKLAKMFGAEKFLSDHGEMDLLGGMLEKMRASPFSALTKTFNVF